MEKLLLKSIKVIKDLYLYNYMIAYKVGEIIVLASILHEIPQWLRSNWSWDRQISIEKILMHWISLIMLHNDNCLIMIIKRCTKIEYLRFLLVGLADCWSIVFIGLAIIYNFYFLSLPKQSLLLLKMSERFGSIWLIFLKNTHIFPIIVFRKV